MCVNPPPPLQATINMMVMMYGMQLRLAHSHPVPACLLYTYFPNRNRTLTPRCAFMSVFDTFPICCER